MSIHVSRAPTVPLTSYDTKRSSHLKDSCVAILVLNSKKKKKNYDKCSLVL